MNIKEELNALHEWKDGGRGETMMSTFDYKSSNDKMFIEGYRVAKEKYCKEWHNWLEKPSVYPNFGLYVLTKFDGGNYQICTYNSMDGCWYTQKGEINLYVDSWKEIE